MMHHIMVTSFEGHWDNINYTGFSSPMLRFKLNSSNKPSADLPTVFIKRKKDGGIEKAWLGKISSLSNKPYKTDLTKWWFNVHITKEIPCPPVLMEYKEGWYTEDLNGIGNSSQPKPVIQTEYQKFRALFYPPFIDKLESTGDWREFEDLTYYLLRLMGINEMHRFDPTNQSGKADGLFKIGRTVIIYDCTLEQNFEQRKAAQIVNYTNLLNGNIIDLEDKSMNITNCDKFVWIIRKNIMGSSVIRHIDDVVTKSVPINDLITLFRNRLEYSWSEKQLEKALQEI